MGGTAKYRVIDIKKPVVPRSSLAVNALALSVLVVCCLFIDSRPSGIVAVIALMVALFFLIKQKPLILLKYLAVVFAWVSTIAGCVVIEYSSIYLSELTLISYYVGCIPLYCLSCWACFVALLLIDAKLEDKGGHTTAHGESGSRNGLTHYASIVLLVFLCVLFASVATRPSFLLGVDRFDYNALYSLGFLGMIANYMNWLIVIPMIALRNGEKLLGGTCIVLYCLYLFWTGTKFGGFFVVLCYVPLVYYDKIGQLNKARLSALIR